MLTLKAYSYLPLATPGPKQVRGVCFPPSLGWVLVFIRKNVAGCILPRCCVEKCPFQTSHLILVHSYRQGRAGCFSSPALITILDHAIIVGPPLASQGNGYSALVLFVLCTYTHLAFLMECGEENWTTLSDSRTAGVLKLWTQFWMGRKSDKLIAEWLLTWNFEKSIKKLSGLQQSAILRNVSQRLPVWPYRGSLSKFWS